MLGRSKPKVRIARFRLVNNAIIIMGSVNGKPVEFILDTGDAIGPVLNAADAARVGAVPGASFGVSGAGGATTSNETEIDVAFGGAAFSQEPAAIDANLQGPSLLGLPFFLAKCKVLAFQWDNGVIEMIG